MAVELQCCVCGKTFASAAPTLQPICPDCQRTAISEQPLPPPDPSPTAVRSGMPAHPRAGISERRHETPGGGTRQFAKALAVSTLLLLSLGAGLAFLTNDCGCQPPRAKTTTNVVE